MLVLSRFAQEALILELPDKRIIRVLVIDMDRGKVRIGVEADRDILVLREELIDEPRPATT